MKVQPPDIPDARVGQCEPSLRPELDSIARAVLDAAPDGILVVDRQGTIIGTNRALQRLTGYPADALLGRPLALLLPEPARGVHAQWV